MKHSIQRNRWSLLSILITVVDSVLIFVLVRYLYGRGLWTANTGFRNLLSMWGGLSVMVSLAAAIGGLAKDDSKTLAVVACVLSLFSVAFYAQ